MEFHSTLHRVSDTAYRFDQEGIGYATTKELDQLRDAANQLRKGQKRHPDAAPFTVFVDGERFTRRTLPAFLRLLSECYIDRHRFVLFRNFDKGVTAHFDKPEQSHPVTRR